MTPPVARKDFFVGFYLGCARAQAILYLIVVVPIVLSRGNIPPMAWLAVLGLLFAIFMLTCAWAFFRYRRVSGRTGHPSGWNMLSEYQRGLAAARIGLALG